MSEPENQGMIHLAEEIKSDIRSTRNIVLSNANRELIFMYFRFGKCISEHASCGSSFIHLLSDSLKAVFSGESGYIPQGISLE